jgi:hypothetical protein
MPSLANDHKPTQWWLVLLLAPFVGVLCVPFFNRVDPQLWGIPFFFWYQFLWVIISAIVTALVYFKATPKFPRRRKVRDDSASTAHEGNAP